MKSSVYVVPTSLTVATLLAMSTTLPSNTAFANATSTNPSASLYANQKITLPDGVVLTGRDSQKSFNGIQFNFQVGLNNHTQVVKQEHIQTPYGAATLDKTVMTSPAANPTKGTWYSYDVLIQPPKSLQGAYGPFQFHVQYPKGQDVFAKQMVIEVAKTWKIDALDTLQSHKYNVNYFSNNHDALTFSINTKSGDSQQTDFGDTDGALTVHVGDTVEFTPDTNPKNSPTPVDVNRVIATVNGSSASVSSYIRITQNRTGKLSFTAQKPGTVTFAFKRAHSSLNGKFVVHVVKR